MTEIFLDLRGLKCPLPALRTRRALARAKPGDAVVVECTDPLASIDVPNAVRESGDVLETQERHGDVRIFRIRRGLR